MNAARDYKDHPYLENYPPLRDWLDENDGRCVFQTSTDQKPLSPDNDAIEGWLVNGGLCMILVRGRRRGWDIFTPGRDPKIAATLADAAARLGITIPPQEPRE